VPLLLLMLDGARGGGGGRRPSPTVGLGWTAVLAAALRRGGGGGGGAGPCEGLARDADVERRIRMGGGSTMLSSGAVSPRAVEGTTGLAGCDWNRDRCCAGDRGEGAGEGIDEAETKVSSDEAVGGRVSDKEAAVPSSCCRGVASPEVGGAAWRRGSGCGSGRVGVVASARPRRAGFGGVWGRGWVAAGRERVFGLRRGGGGWAGEVGGLDDDDGGRGCCGCCGGCDGWAGLVD
jgi:hypothetical protein